MRPFFFGFGMKGSNRIGSVKKRDHYIWGIISFIDPRRVVLPKQNQLFVSMKIRIDNIFSKCMPLNFRFSQHLVCTRPRRRRIKSIFSKVTLGLEMITTRDWNSKLTTDMISHDYLSRFPWLPLCPRARINCHLSLFKKILYFSVQKVFISKYYRSVCLGAISIKTLYTSIVGL